MKEVIDQLRSSLGDRFAVEGEVGRGGMGIVFRARDLEHDRDVAIKVLRPEFRASVASARWVREIEIVHQLDHPNILSMYESGEADGLLYSVMPFVDGESLRERLRREDQLPLEAALRIAYQVADAMAYAHARGIMHRDIKPANILLADGKALVSDFGIARAITVAGGDELTESGVAVGTPSYMSPEQAAGGSKLDGRSDVYSLGCVLYEMLVGEPPFTGHSAQVIIARQIQERHPAIRVPRPSVPEAVEYAVDRALEKTPADRFATSDEFRDALNGFVTGDYTADVRLRTKSRRHWGSVSAAAAVLIAAIAWLIWPRTPPVLSERHVMVFPTTATADSGNVEWIADALPIIVANALEGGRLRGLLAWKWLNTRQRENVGIISARQQRRTAWDRRARYFITSSAAAFGDSIRLHLELTDAETDSLIHEVREVGVRADLGAFGFQAAAQLISKIGSANRLFAGSPFEGREREAITQFLRGEIVYNRGQFEEALGHYESVLAADSTFWMAALRGAHAAGWSRDSWFRAAELVTLALPHTSQMSNAQLFLVQGMAAAFRGDADLALQELNRALEVDSTLAEVWMARGEVFQWLLPDEPRRDSLALDAFQRVVELDPEFVPALYHLQELTLRRGDLKAAGRFYRQYLSSRPDSSALNPIRIMLQCLTQGPESIDWRAEVRIAPIDVLYAARSMSVGGANLDCAVGGLHALMEYEDIDPRQLIFSAMDVLQSIHVARREFSSAAALIDEATNSYTSSWASYSIVYFAASGALEDRAARRAEALGTDYASLPIEHLWPLAAWQTQVGRPGALESILDAVVERSGSGTYPEYQEAGLRLFARVVRARLALAQGDSAMAIDSLRVLRPRATPSMIRAGGWGTLAAEQMLLARLLMARAAGASEDAAARDYGVALDIALNLANGEPPIFLAYLRPSLEIVHAAAAALGDTNREREVQRRLDALGGADKR